MGKKYRYLGLSERENIERLHRGGATAAVIADAIGAHPATVYRELLLGQVFGPNGEPTIDECGRRAYSAEVAQRAFEDAMKRRGRRASGQ